MEKNKRNSVTFFYVIVLDIHSYPPIQLGFNTV
jgi:hypothetical protein